MTSWIRMTSHNVEKQIVLLTKHTHFFEFCFHQWKSATNFKTASVCVYVVRFCSCPQIEFHQLQLQSFLVWAGWPDRPNFRLRGELFTLGSFSKNYGCSAYFWATFFHRTTYVCIRFDKKCAGLHFGRFFNKRIWSPYIHLRHPSIWSCQKHWSPVALVLQAATSL
jgi:hypothetical protein